MILNLLATITSKHYFNFFFCMQVERKNLRVCIIYMCVLLLQHPFSFLKLTAPVLSVWGPPILYSGSMWFSSG